MKTLTFTVSKGGVGKSLITANVGAALAKRERKVILIEGDPNHPLQLMLGAKLSNKSVMLDEVVKQNLPAEKALYETDLKNLYLMPSGMSLQGYFDVDPIRFAKKIADLKADFIMIDTPFPLGKAAFMSLGVCEYFVPILTEDEFVLCVESAIDTIRLGKYYLKCIPLGFVLNRLKTAKKFTDDFVRDLENLLEIPCLAKIPEDPRVAKSYGGATAEKAFLAYRSFPDSEFAGKIDLVARFLDAELPRSEKKDVTKHLQSLLQK